jgi:long-chain acyl-CoA synthetase
MPNLVATLHATVHSQPERVAIRSRSTTLSFAELWAAAARFGQQLRERGVTAGDRVALAMPNIPRYAVAHYGTLLVGAVVVPLNPTQPGTVLTARIRDANPRLVVVAQGPPATIERAAAADRVPLCELTGNAEGFAEVDVEPVSDDAPAVIAYKPTDIEEPTGVVLSHNSLAWSGAAAADVLGLTFADTLATHFPLFHLLGQTYGLTAAVAAGCTLAIPALDAASALDVLGTSAATVLTTFPMVIGALLSDDIAAAGGTFALLRTVFCSGGRNLDPRRRAQVAARLGCEVLEGYGTLETSAIGSAARSGEPSYPGSMGRAVAGAELAVVDGRGRTAVARKPGGLVARGPNVMTGYWQRPKDTARAFSNGWLLTGDKARQDADGNIYLLDNLWWTDPLRGRDAGREGLLRRGMRKLRH